MTAAVPELAAAEAWAREYAAKPEKERHREVRAILAEIERLRGALPEVACPSCGATIRARMADAPVTADQLDHAARAAYYEEARGADFNMTVEWGRLPGGHRQYYRDLARAVALELGMQLRA